MLLSSTIVIGQQGWNAIVNEQAVKLASVSFLAAEDAQAGGQHAAI